MTVGPVLRVPSTSTQSYHSLTAFHCNPWRYWSKLECFRLPNSMAENGAAEAGPSRLSASQPWPYQTTSQYQHWRFSPAQLRSVREELNARSKEVTKRNVQLEQVCRSSFHMRGRR